MRAALSMVTLAASSDAHAQTNGGRSHGLRAPAAGAVIVVLQAATDDGAMLWHLLVSLASWRSTAGACRASVVAVDDCADATHAVRMQPQFVAAVEAGILDFAVAPPGYVVNARDAKGGHPSLRLLSGGSLKLCGEYVGCTPAVIRCVCT